MVQKNQYVLGCYKTLDEVAKAIKDLKARGCRNEDITLVTREDYVPAYSQITDIEFQTEEEVMAKEKREADGEESLWEKMKDTFSVENPHRHKTKKPNYQTDDDPLYGYQDDLDKGCIVVMVKGAEWLREDAEEIEVPPRKDRPADASSEKNEDSEIDLLNATDAMRTNVITSTDKNAVMDSGLVDEDEDDKYLHNNEAQTRGPL